MASHGDSNDKKHKELMESSLKEALVKKTENILLQVLIWGTPLKNSNESFHTYLVRQKGSNILKQMQLNKDQLSKLNDTCCAMDSFDVTLLYRCIKYGCDGLASPNDTKWSDKDLNSLEWQITKAKNYRNWISHEKPEVSEEVFYNKLQEIEDLLNLILDGAAKLFSKIPELQQLKDELKEELSEIRIQPFIEFPSSRLCEEFKIRGREELKESYKDYSKIGPVSNLIDKEMLDMETIFTQTEIYDYETQTPLNLNKMFEHVQFHSSQRKNVLLLVEGNAGSGKTTLIRKILHEWLKDSSKMKNLNYYNLAIATDCRDGEKKSLAELLRSLMCDVTKQFKSDKMIVTNIQNNTILFTVDGYDELNKSSEQVFEDILSLEYADTTIVCTTRPNKVRKIKEYVGDKFRILHLKIKGIKDRVTFVKNYYLALKGPDQILASLLDFLKKGSYLHEHWKLPFNLVLLTILWMRNPNVVNELTTATELFQKTLEFCKKRQIQRLNGNEEPRGQDSNKFEEDLRPFLKGMDKIAFDCHCDNKIELLRVYVTSLKEACHLKCLPPEEVISSFLVQTVSLIDKNQDKISFPHKGIQEFLCARHIEDVLKKEDTQMNLDIPRMFSSFDPILNIELRSAMKMRLIQVWKEDLYKIVEDETYTYPTIQSAFQSALYGAAVSNTVEVGQLDWSKWRNVFVHLVGLLHEDGSLTEERAKEMVRLLEETGLTDPDEWFECFANVKWNTTISKYIVLKGNIFVTDVRVQAFRSLMNSADPDGLTISIETDPSMTPGLKELLEALREKVWKVKLEFHHDYQVPKESCSFLDETLRELFRSNPRLEVFTGQVSASALDELPSSVNDLRLCVKDGAHFTSLLPGLTSWAEERNRMLRLHVPVDIEELSLQPLPRGPLIRLFMSGVSEATVEKASVVARKLQPSGGSYAELIFPGLGKTPRVCKQLVKELGCQEVRVEETMIVSPSMIEEDLQQMEELVKENLNCLFR